MDQITAHYVLNMLHKLPPHEQLKVIAEALPELEKKISAATGPKKSLLGFLSDLGPAPSADEIDQARLEAWSNFPRKGL